MTDIFVKKIYILLNEIFLSKIMPFKEIIISIYEIDKHSERTLFLRSCTASQEEAILLKWIAK